MGLLHNLDDLLCDYSFGHGMRRVSRKERIANS